MDYYAVLGSGSGYFNSCFGVCLLAGSSKVVLSICGTNTRGRECQHRITPSLRFCQLLFKMLVGKDSWVILRVIHCLITLGVMTPIDKPETRGDALICSNGGSADLPCILRSAAQHRVLNANKGLINLLGDSRTGRQHDAPLVLSCNTGSFRCTLCLAKVQRTVWVRGCIAKSKVLPVESSPPSLVCDKFSAMQS